MLKAGERLGDWVAEHDLGRGPWGRRWRVRNALVPTWVGAAEVAAPEAALVAMQTVQALEVRGGRLGQVLGAGLGDRHVWVVHRLPAGEALTVVLQRLDPAGRRMLLRQLVDRVDEACDAGLDGTLLPADCTLESGALQLCGLGLGTQGLALQALHRWLAEAGWQVATTQLDGVRRALEAAPHTQSQPTQHGDQPTEEGPRGQPVQHGLALRPDEP